MFRPDRWIVWVILFFGVPAWGAAPIVFCWSANTVQPGLSPMAMVGCDNTPTQFVSKVATSFANLPPAQRSLMLFGCLTQPSVFSAANLKSIVENGPDCTVEQRYLQLIFTQMKARGLVPARIVLDMETNICTWSLTPASGNLSSVLMNVYGDSASLTKLPAALQQFSPADFQSSNNNTRYAPATIAWNSWQTALIAQALRQTVAVTANNIFQTKIPVTNYEDILPSFTVYDLNGWPLSGGAVGSESSPCLYLSVDGNRYLYLQRDARWNHFIDSLNQARSALRNGPVVPWLAYPGYAGDSHQHSGSTWLWHELVKHLNAMGVTQYLLFNPQGEALLSDDQFASKVFQTIQTPAKQPPVNYAPIPLDAASVTTSTVTTNYSDFLSNLLGGANAVMK